MYVMQTFWNVNNKYMYLSRGDGAISKPPEHLWTSDKPEKQAIAKTAWATFSTNSYLPDWLVNMYSYRLMVKSVS